MATLQASRDGEDAELFSAVHYSLGAVYFILALAPTATVTLRHVLKRRAGKRDSVYASVSERPTDTSPLLKAGAQSEASKKARSPTYWWKVYFHVTYTLACIARGVYLCVCAAQPHREDRVGAVNFGLNYIPTFLFFTCYYVVLAYWIEAYHGRRARNESMSVRSLVSISLAVSALVSLLVFIGFCIADAVIGDDVDNPTASTSLIHKIFTAFTGALYLLLALLFITYGALMTAKVLSTAAAPNHVLGEVARNVVLRVSLLALLCFCCFVARGAVVLWGITESHTEIAEGTWWFDLVYFVPLEVMPLGLTLFLLRQRRSLRARVVKSGRTTAFSQHFLGRTPTATVPTSV